MIGDLKHRVELGIIEETKDSAGYKKKEWVTLYTVWSELRENKRRRVVINDTEHEQLSYTATIRYRNLPQKPLYLRFQGITYSINEIQDKDFQKRFLTLFLSKGGETQ